MQWDRRSRLGKVSIRADSRNRFLHMERDWTHAGIQEAAYAALAKGLAGAAGAISVRQITVNTYPGKSNESCQ